MEIILGSGSVLFLDLGGVHLVLVHQVDYVVFP